MIGDEIVLRADAYRYPRKKLKSQISIVQRMCIVGQVYAGVNLSSLAKQFERYKVNQSVDRSVGSGRQSITNEREDRMIAREVHSNRRISTVGIKANLNLCHLSNKTISRRIKELTNNVTDRLKWAHEHIG
jgi:hypothetical protein